MSEFENWGFEQAVAKYAKSLTAFRMRYRLPQEWFPQPDHLAVKCLDAEHFDAIVQRWLPDAYEASYIELDGRRLASVHLGGKLALSKSLGSVEWLEVMEPRPEKAGLDTVGIDHVEYVFPDFAAAMAALETRNIPYELQSNPNHKWLNIPINPRGQELKLNNRPLADMVSQGLEDGEAKLL